MSTAMQTQPNLAPAKDIQQAVETHRPPSKPFHQWFKSVMDQLLLDDEPLWQECFDYWELIHHYLNGELALRKRHRGSGWERIKLDQTTTNSAAKNFNRLGFYHRQLLARTGLARTQYETSAVDDTDRGEGAARAGAQWLHFYDKKLYTAQFRQKEIISGHTFGAVARYFTVRNDGSGPLGRRPQFAAAQVTAFEGASECLECGARQPYTEGLDACPDCGSELVEQQAPEQAEVQQTNGYETFRAPQLVCEQVPYTQLRHEFRKSLPDSLYLKWTRSMRGEEIRAAFPQIKLRAPGIEDKGLKAEQGMTGTTELEEGKLYEVSMWWLAPAMYADYIFPEDTPTVDGATIPMGTEAKQIFKKGMVSLWVRGINQPLFVADEHHRECWAAGQYRTKLFSGVGLPLKDAIEMAQTYNYLMNLVLKQIATGAIPGWLYDENAITVEYVSLLGRHDANVPVAGLEGRSLDQVVHQMSPGQIPAHIPAFIQMAENNLQSSVGALDFGVWGGVRNETATGAEYANAASAGHLTPELENRAQLDIDSAYLILQLVKKHMPFEVYLQIKNEAGLQDGQWFAGYALDELIIEAGKDSSETKTLMEERQDYQQAWALVGGLQGYLMMLQMAPDALVEVENLYGVNLGGKKHRAARLLARQRVDQLTQTVQAILSDQNYLALLVQQAAVQQMAQPQLDAAGQPIPAPPLDLAMIIAQEAHTMLGSNPDPSQPSIFPVGPYEMGLMEGMVWLRQWLTLDDGKNAPRALQAAIELLIKNYVQALTMEQMVTSAVGAIAGLMPGVMAGQTGAAPEQAAPEKGGPRGKRPAGRNLQPGAPAGAPPMGM